MLDIKDLNENEKKTIEAVVRELKHLNEFVKGCL
jgi:hypothetical protein